MFQPYTTWKKTIAEQDMFFSVDWLSHWFTVYRVFKLNCNIKNLYYLKLNDCMNLNKICFESMLSDVFSIKFIGYFMQQTILFHYCSYPLYSSRKLGFCLRFCLWFALISKRLELQSWDWSQIEDNWKQIVELLMHCCIIGFYKQYIMENWYFPVFEGKFVLFLKN